jgi:hypothetical protein
MLNERFNCLQDRKCPYNVMFEARSDILPVKLTNEISMASLPCQPQCALVTGVGERARYSEGTHLGPPLKCPLFWSDFNENGILSPIQTVVKIRPIAAELFHVD